MDSKDRATGELVFHYTTAAVAIEHILASMKIRLGPIDRTHDPSEGHRENTGSSDAGEGPPDFAAWHRVDELARCVRVACFCRDGEGSGADPCALGFAPPWAGWARDRMWAQYAGGHTGVCLAFDRRRLVDAFADAVSGRGEAIAQDVAYNDDPHNLSYDNVRIRKLGAGPYATAYRREHAPVPYLMKRLDYQGEREFRLVLLDEDASGIDAFVPVRGALVYAMLGDRFPKAYLPCIDAVMRREGLPIYWLKYESGRNVSAYTYSGAS